MDRHRIQNAMTNRSRTTVAIYAAAILLITGSFLAEILRGGCPVP